MTFKTGWLKDAEDSRDKNAVELMAASPRPATRPKLENFLPEPYDQLQTSSCVANAGSGAIFTRWGAQGFTNRRKPSVLWLYDIARAINDAHLVDEGTYLRNLGQSMHVMGIASDESWPFSEANVNTRPPWKAMRAAYDQRWMSGYFRISETGQARIDHIKTALDLGYPVVYGMNITQEWFDYSKGVLANTGKHVGGHATFLYDYNDVDACLFGQNSWNKTWGEHGRYRIKMSAIASADASDLWIFQTVPKDSGT